MAGDLEANDSSSHNETASGDLINFGFSPEDQQAVFKQIAQSQSDNLTELDLKEDRSSDSSQRRVEFPHNWYQSGKSNAYSLPSETQFTGGMESTLKNGWNKLNS